MLPKKMSMGKKIKKNGKHSCQIPIFSSKTINKILKPCIVLCFDLQSAALLTVREIQLKDPR